MGGSSHWRSIVPLQPGPQSKGVLQAIGADIPGVHHLRLRLEFIIEREQRVVDHIIVIARDIRCSPDRARIFQVRVWNDSERASGPQSVGTPQDQEANAQEEGAHAAMLPCRGGRHGQSPLAGKCQV